MDASDKREHSAASSTGPGGTGLPPHTSRGRTPDAALPLPGAKGNPLGEPIMKRQRANSVRRLPVETLQGLASTDGGHVGTAARRELDVRQGLLDESRAQFPGPGPSRHMNALAPVGIREVNAMRFAASMAEEAQDEIIREKVARGERPEQVGQIGVASVGGHIGVGFSGQSSKMGHTRAVEQRMLDLQKHYDSVGQSGHWTGRLEETRVTDVFAQSDANICAAKRAAHVAHSLARGPDYLPSPVGREQIPPPDALIEMMNPAISGRGNMLSNYSAARKRGTSTAGTGPAPTTISGRSRSASVDNMANSCDTCMKEHEAHMSKRGK
ncbi:MAG TPA: hypothetical protein VEC06_10315 [Paucimonas sp.]|nr:hypothetical protein [Paucimonas sp.]